MTEQELQAIEQDVDFAGSDIDVARELVAEVRRLQGLLAECYRESGADPDGNEDWRLADGAVEAIREVMAR